MAAVRQDHQHANMKCIEQPSLSFDLDGNGISMLLAAAGEILELLHYERIPDAGTVIGISGREARSHASCRIFSI